MEKIAISSSHHEWRDSLAQDWTNCLWDQGFQTVLIPNHLDSCREYLRDAVLLILSGGDDLQLQHRGQDSNDPRAVRDQTEFLLLESARGFTYSGSMPGNAADQCLFWGEDKSNLRRLTRGH